MSKVTHTVYLGLGSNLGDRERKLEEAIRLIDERVGRVLRRSSFVESEPWGFISDNMFLNAVICCETVLTPRELLTTTQGIERDLGKSKAHATQRPNSPLTAHHSPPSTPHSPLSTLHPPLSTLHSPLFKDRPIDIDILLYDDLTIDEPDLKVPHPLMWERDFVMIPLREIADL